MPNKDMTGPEGNGPGTGRGKGKCFNLKKIKKIKEKNEKKEYGIGQGGEPRHLRMRNK